MVSSGGSTASKTSCSLFELLYAGDVMVPKTVYDRLSGQVCSCSFGSSHSKHQQTADRRQTTDENSF